MFSNSRLARALALAAVFSMATPAIPVYAAPKTTQPATRGLDVVLVGGQLNGKLLNANGRPVEGVPVVISKNDKIVGRAVTQADGSYQVRELTSGIHTVSLSEGQFPVRLWSQGSAPASARNQLTVSQTAVRGQYMTQDGLLLTTAGIATVALIVAIVALIEAEEDEDSPASP